MFVLYVTGSKTVARQSRLEFASITYSTHGSQEVQNR